MAISLGLPKFSIALFEIFKLNIAFFSKTKKTIMNIPTEINDARTKLRHLSLFCLIQQYIVRETKHINKGVEGNGVEKNVNK